MSHLFNNTSLIAYFSGNFIPLIYYWFQTLRKPQSVLHVKSLLRFPCQDYRLLKMVIA